MPVTILPEHERPSPNKSFFAGAIIKPNSIGAVCIFVTNVIAAFTFIDV